MADIFAFINENHWFSYTVGLIGFCVGVIIIRGNKSEYQTIEQSIRLFKIHQEVVKGKKDEAV